MIRLSVIMALMFLLFTGRILRAQDEGGEQDRHSAAAYELIEAMQIERQVEKTMDDALEIMFRQSSMSSAVKAAGKEFLQKYLSWENMKDFYMQQYRKEFTVTELQELTEFYRSPVGRKFALCAGRLATEAMAWSQKELSSHQGELQERIRQVMEDEQQ